MNIKTNIQRFYDNWLVCDDPICNNNTQVYTHVTEQGKPLCFVCKKGLLLRQFTEKDLFNQLSYYKYVFTFDEKDLTSKKKNYVT